MDRVQLQSRDVSVDLSRSLTTNERNACVDYLERTLVDTHADKRTILSTIPLTAQPSSAPLSILSTLLTALPGRWPVFDLICCYTRLWKHLPESVKSGSVDAERNFLARIDCQIKNSYSDIASLLPTTNLPAIQDSNSSACLTHLTLSSFVKNFSLPVPNNTTSKLVVALALSNGPLLGVAILATTAHFIAAPLSVFSGQGQFRSDLLQSGASAVLVAASDVARLGLDQPWVTERMIKVMILEQKSDLTFSMAVLNASGNSDAEQSHIQPSANGPSDTALLLFTSGTSGTKKSVPITIHAMVSGIAFIIESWGLKSDDICLNMMPLFHVGGILRNLFAPIMAGGSTVCCPAFDPNLFWDMVEDRQPTWYYASPSMHSVILEEAHNRQDALIKSKMRLVCNAAGGLLPSLACNLRDTFKCVVLPSYGMTECMPISSPPLNYQLDLPGTSGHSVGPEIGILDHNDNAMEAGIVGRIAVRGAPVFEGYLRTDGEIDRSPFTTAGWFDTGDMGYLNAAGYLYVTGRSKEVINRGGELISPFEVEEAVLQAAQRSDSPISGRVFAALAFSVSHDVLQEVVGLVVVTPKGQTRPCLNKIQLAVKDSLNQAKWPVFVVYMDDLPKNNNKVMRIKLAERLQLREISDSLSLAKRHFEAQCPPPNSLLSVKIAGSACRADVETVLQRLQNATGSDFDIHVRSASTDGYLEAFIAPSAASISHTPSTCHMDLSGCWQDLDDYSIPAAVHFLDEPLPHNGHGKVDANSLDLILHARSKNGICGSDLTTTEGKLARIFSGVLKCSLDDLSSGSDFFAMGGDSLRAGRLLSELRKEFHLRLPIDLLFRTSQLGALAEYLDSLMDTSSIAETVVADVQKGCSETYSSTNPFLLILQLFPIVLFYPMKRALTWTVFVYMLATTLNWVTTQCLPGRLFNLMICLGIGKAITQAATPLVGILMKWIIIGKYKEGIYPMWGPYHTRWWIVQKILAICGRGHFALSNTTLVWYYRLLGAKIGKNVTIALPAVLGEYDLLDIADGVNLDKCTCRGFAVEQNTTMYLGRISLGVNSSVGLNSIIAPGTSLPDQACIGPNSSSWEKADADESFRDLSANKIPGTHFLLDLLISLPLAGIVTLFRAGPWMAGLIGIVKSEPGRSEDMIKTTIDWFAEPKRISFHYLALILNSYFGPMAWFLAVFVIKKMVDALIGKQTPGMASTRSQMQRLRMSLLKKIIPLSQFHSLLENFGSHYEFTSIFYRALGAKVGERVYWPGTGPSVQDFDLLDIGDDVVFGSRSHLVTSDGTGSHTVRIGDGAMIADRVVILPGAEIGEHTVLGSGALTRRNRRYAADTVWVGSKAGEAVCLSGGTRRNPILDSEHDLRAGVQERLTLVAETTPQYSQGFDDGKTPISAASTLVPPTPVGKRSLRNLNTSNPSSPDVTSSGASTLVPPTPIETIEREKKSPLSITVTPLPCTDEPPTPGPTSPFGRAFYSALAPYRVWGLPTIFLYSSLTTIFVSFYWNVATTSSIQLIARILLSTHHIFSTHAVARPIIIYALFALSISILQTLQALFALSLVIAAKWTLLGRRQPGNYDWDKSAYCQRWQLFLTTERLRRHCYGGQGILGLLTGTHYMVLYFRALGAEIGSDCALFAGGRPSCLFTEPDLLTLGDRVSVDDASLVGHVNSRGVFDLNRLEVGSGSALRSGSRLLSGARMGADAVLMEHTLVMGGDFVEDGSVVQGWPGDLFSGSRMPTLVQE